MYICIKYYRHLLHVYIFAEGIAWKRLLASEEQYEYCHWPHLAFCSGCHQKEQVSNEISSTGNTASTGMSIEV